MNSQSFHSHQMAKAAASTIGNETKEQGNWFWKIFGGAVISVIALLLLTVGQYLNLSINDLRSDAFKINRELGDCIKQQDYKQDIKDLQQQIEKLKERIVILENKK